MRRIIVTATVVATLLLTACGGSETTERAAFVGFLKARVLQKPGVHVPQLTDAERSSFGHYADHYAVIDDFNKTMSQSVSPNLTAAMATGSITSLEDAVTRRAQLKAAKASMNAMAVTLGDALGRANAASAKLDQPADLQPVYKQAYDRLVTQPAAVLKDIAPVMEAVLGQAIDLGEYIDAHRSAIRLSGSTIEASDPVVRAEISQRLKTLQSSQQAVQTAQTRMRSVVYGTR